MIKTTIAAVIVAGLAVIALAQSSHADGLYACWYQGDRLLMSGYYHPAALEGGPIGGPDINGGIYVEIGEDCDYRVGSEEVPAWTTPTPTSTPTPTPTATPTPTPVSPTPTPVLPLSSPTPTPEPGINVCAVGSTAHAEVGFLIFWFAERGEYPCGFWHPKWGLLYIYGSL